MSVQQKPTNTQEEIPDDKLQKEGPPPVESKGTKTKKTALSLFDEDDDDDDDDDFSTDEIIPAPKPSKSTEKNALKVTDSNIQCCVNLITTFSRLFIDFACNFRIMGPA